MPSDAPVLLAVALCAVLVVSATAKLADTASTRSVVVLLRLPNALHGSWFASALPIGELVLAAAMLAPWLAVARVGWTVATALFAAYLAVIARAMTFTPRPSCGCFGRIGDQRVTSRTVVRNVLLLLSSAVVLLWVLDGSTVPTALAALDREDWAWAVAAVVVAAIAVFILGGAPTPKAARAPVADRPSAPDPTEYVRTPNPSSLLLTPDGEPVLLDVLARHAARLVVFLHLHDDDSRAAVASRATQWAHDLGPVELTVVVPGTPAELVGLPEELRTFAHADPFGRATREVVGHTPAAVLLGADGLLAGGPVHATQNIIGFVDEVLAELYSDSDAEQVIDAR